jgi:hypothetical protein
MMASRASLNQIYGAPSGWGGTVRQAAMPSLVAASALCYFSHVLAQKPRQTGLLSQVLGRLLQTYWRRVNVCADVLAQRCAAVRAGLADGHGAVMSAAQHV